MPPITFAHRGGRAGAPENTIEAFRRALDLGAAGVESDARLSADGEVVLAHAPVVRQGLRRLKVAATPASRLAGAGVLRLADLYAELGCDFELSLDLKDRAVAGPVLDVARAAGATRRLWLCSSDLDLLGGLRHTGDDVRLVNKMPRRGSGAGLERRSFELARAGVAALNLHEADWSLGVVSLAHRFGLLAFAWDAQETRRLRALLGMGIDAVYSDHVERMVASVGEWSTGAPDPRQPGL